MKSQVKRAGVAAMVLAGSMMMSGVASAGDRDDLAPTVTKEELESLTIEVTKTGSVVTHQLIDGVDFTFEWEGVEWPEPVTGDSATAKGILGTLWDIAVKAVKEGLAGGGKDGGGGGTTNSCTVNVNVTGGAQSVNIGNINCGGTQGSGNGTGSGPA